MNEDIMDAIKSLANRINDTSTPDEALKFTQAALNLANAAITLSNIKPSNIP